MRSVIKRSARLSQSLHASVQRSSSTFVFRQQFSNTRTLKTVKPYLLADIGEGITECQIISWLVKPGDKIQQFEPICEVQSDKASVEITSRFDGVITKLHYEVDEMAAVGSPLIDIDVEGEEKPTLAPKSEVSEPGGFPTRDPIPRTTEDSAASLDSFAPNSAPKNSGLVIPAVRHMTKEHNLDLAEIEGTGKGGRVQKEDVQRYLAERRSSKPPERLAVQNGHPSKATIVAEDQVVPLTHVQRQMFQSMTRSLEIPHFLYTNIVDMTDVTKMRKGFTNNRALTSQFSSPEASSPKLTPLSFVLKALSIAIEKFPSVNASLDTDTNPSQPQLIIKGSHNIGVAMDTPKGLVVPVLRNVQDHSIMSLAAEVERLGLLAREGKLGPDDMKGASIVVSNIGSIGGHTVGPLILSPNVMILGIGRSQHVPVFKTDENGIESIVKREQVILSWSADHRVLDGATVARCAQAVGTWLENIDKIGLLLR